jgi:hypothetical protein
VGTRDQTNAAASSASAEPADKTEMHLSSIECLLIRSTIHCGNTAPPAPATKITARIDPFHLSEPLSCEYQETS